MRLILLRHGIAVQQGAGRATTDARRPLTAQGRARTQRAALGLRALGVSPQVLLSSPHLRALQTARIVADVLGLPRKAIVLSEALLPDAPPQRLFAELRARKESELLCTGHAPHLDRALALALGVRGAPPTRLKKAGAAAVELERRQPLRGRLLWLLEPAALRRLARKAPAHEGKAKAPTPKAKPGRR
jgi:phosphohistidine phosphatase